LEGCDRAQAVSDDALRAVFETFELKPDAIGLPDDPFSGAYRDRQFEFYRLVHSTASAPVFAHID
jgi:hypothetical protein